MIGSLYDMAVGVSPAHAGMYPGLSSLSMTWRSFPRTRGDVPYLELCQETLLAFPPHTRGCTGVGLLRAFLSPVSPAHAGMYRASNPSPHT